MKKDWAGGEAAYREAVRRNVPLGEMGAYAMLTIVGGQFRVRPRDSRGRAAAESAEQ